MNPMHPIAVVNDHLLNEIARTDLSLHNVLFLYGCLVVVAAGLWAIGVVMFGRRRAPLGSVEASHPRERATPVSP